MLLLSSPHRTKLVTEMANDKNLLSSEVRAIFVLVTGSKTMQPNKGSLACGIPRILASNQEENSSF